MIYYTEKLEEFNSQIRDYEKEYNRVKKILSYLEDRKDSFLYSIMSKITIKASEAKLKRLAQCDIKWIRYTKRINNLREVCGELRADKDMALRSFEALRSEMAYQRAKIQARIDTE